MVSLERHMERRLTSRNDKHTNNHKKRSEWIVHSEKKEEQISISEEELGRERFYSVLLALQKEEIAAKATAKATTTKNDQVRLLNATIANRRQRYQEKQHWQFDLHDELIERGFR